MYGASCGAFFLPFMKPILRRASDDRGTGVEFGCFLRVLGYMFSKLYALGRIRAMEVFEYVYDWLAPVAGPSDAALLRSVLQVRFSAWKTIYARKASLQRVLSHMVNPQQSLSMSTWRSAAADSRQSREKLRRALKALTLTQARKGLNTWHAQFAERRAKREQLAFAIRRAHPEGRAMVAALRKLYSHAAEMVMLARGAVAFIKRAQNAALNTWCAGWRTQRDYEQRMRSALLKMSPEGRAMRHVLVRLRAISEAKARAQNVVLRVSPEGRSMRSVLIKLWELCAANARMRSSLLKMTPEGLAMRRVLRKLQAIVDAQGKARDALFKMSPEGRAMCSALMKLRAIAKAKAKMRHALLKITPEGCSMGHAVSHVCNVMAWIEFGLLCPCSELWLLLS